MYQKCLRVTIENNIHQYFVYFVMIKVVKSQSREESVQQLATVHKIQIKSCMNNEYST